MKNLQIVKTQKTKINWYAVPFLILMFSSFLTTSTTAQSSRFYPEKTDYYTISLNGKNMTVKGTAKAEANIELAAPNGSDHQKFRIIEQLNNGKSTNYYLIETKAKKGLYVTIHYSRLKEGTNIKLNPRKNNNQLWTFKDNAIETKLNLNRFIGTKGNNNLVIVHKSQRFTFTKVGGSTTPPVTTTPTTPKIKVKAAVLSAVTFSKGGKPNGSFEKIGNKKWGEFKLNKNTVHAEFEETHRDKFSVYLHDKKRNIKVRLDLHTKKVYVGSNPYYDITSASDEMVLSGYTAATVRVEGQYFQKMFDGEWYSLFNSPSSKELDVRSIYKEVSRDRNTVKLVSKFGKKVQNVSLDIKRKKYTKSTTGAETAMSNGTFTSDIKSIKIRSAILPGRPPAYLIRPNNLSKNCYTLTSSILVNKNIDVYSGNTKNGAEVNFWGANNSKNQLFWFAPVSSIEYMMVPQINKRVAVGYSNSNKKKVTIKTGMSVTDSGNPKPNSNLSIQLYWLKTLEGNYVAIKTKEGFFKTENGKLVISKKYTGLECLFIIEQSNVPRPVNLTLPKSERPLLTDKELRETAHVKLKNGSLSNYSGTKIWVRKDKSGKVIDVLREENPANGKIVLKTENTLSSSFPLSSKFNDLYVGRNHVTNQNNAIIDEVVSFHQAPITLNSQFSHLRMLKYKGMVVMMYASNKATYTDGCSGGAPREKELFKKACDAHDDNWAAPWRQMDYSNEVGQKLSDAIFFDDMRSINADSDNPIDDIASGFFYRAVRSTEEAQNNFLNKRKEEYKRHQPIYKPDASIRNAFKKIIEAEYPDDVLDDVVWTIGKGKDFIVDDVVPFFEDIF